MIVHRRFESEAQKTQENKIALVVYGSGESKIVEKAKRTTLPRPGYG